MFSTLDHYPTMGRSHRRRAVVIVKVAILSVVLVGFAALAVDVGVLVNAGHELERCVESAAIAGASTLARSGLDNFEPARESARACALENEVTGAPLHISGSDVEFGWAEDSGNGVYSFTADPSNVNAVRVTGRRTEANNEDGPIELIFAAVLGFDSTDMTRFSTAMMRPRDIVMVVDISDSVNNDSELRNLRRVEINIGDVWAALPGGLDEPALPPFTNEWDSSWNGDPRSHLATGFGWGFFQRNPASNKWGNGFGYVMDGAELHLGSTSYNPDQDFGLLPMPSGVAYDGSSSRVDWIPSGDGTPYAEIVDYLQSIGYKGSYSGDVASVGLPVPFDEFDPRIPLINYETADGILTSFGLSVEESEIDAILSDYAEVLDTSFQTAAWESRVAVATGFAKWNSGIKVGGSTMLWEIEGWTEPASYNPPNPGGAYGNWIVEPEELVWETTTLGGRSPGEMRTLWHDYLEYMATPETPMLLDASGGDSRFAYKIGLKTFTNFLLARKPSHEPGGDLSQVTPEFVNTPTQPLQAEKDALRSLVDDMDPLLGDRLGLEVYATTVRHLIDLTGLTTDRYAVPDALDTMQAHHFINDSFTNIAGGIRQARETLTGPGARPAATKVIILVSDGIATAWEEYDASGAVTGVVQAQNFVEEAEAANRAIQQAVLAGQEGIVIYAVSLGAKADTAMMVDIANETNGLHFHVERFPDPANPLETDAYVQELKDRFEEIAVIRPVTLVE